MSSIRTLLVEDNPADQAIVQRMLKRYGSADFELTCVSSTAECLERLQDGSFDLLLLDYNLPSENGLSFLRRLKNYVDMPPVIMLTGQGDERIAAEAIRAGAYDYFPKDSLDSEMLAHSIHQALQKYRTEREEDRLRDELQTLVVTDSLTGLHNRRYLHERLADEINRAEQHRHSLALMLLDVDNFKLFNDTYGHLGGDRVLRLVAEALVETSAENDIVARYGGDEFVIVLPNVSRHEAYQAGEQLRKHVSGATIDFEGSEPVPVAVSVGIAFYPDDATSEDRLIARADAALYVSKEAGGNLITLSGDERNTESDKESNTFGALAGLVRTIDRKDRHTGAHSKEMAALAQSLGKSLGLPRDVIEALHHAGLLHDVGKIGTPDYILKKPGPLTPEERQIMQQHVVLSDLIVQGVPHLAHVAAAVRTHHERYDGTGYPGGLKGEQIPLVGRILAVVDAYSAMTMDRPYRKALTPDQAKEELRRGAGLQFDSELVDVFMDILAGEGETQQAA